MWHNPLIIIHYFSGIATVMSVFHVLFSVPNHIYFSKYAFRLLPIIITQDSERLYMFNQFNLASDLMEPFRIIVDRRVISMMPEEFEHEEKMCLVNLMNTEVSIDGRINNVSNAIKIYCRSVFDALNEKDISLIRFYKNEL